MNPTCVVIGNFDGVHLGHQAVVKQARAIADARGLRCVVLTFEPHPALVLGRNAPARLTTADERAQLLREHGAHDVLTYPFTQAFAAWTAEQFVNDLIVAELGARVVVVGRNFRFGRDRQGDIPMLRDLGERAGFEAVIATIAGDASGAYSSTRVRHALAAGDVTDAARLLARPHAIQGTVVHGDARGRQIGFPTANLSGVEQMLPARGVYAVNACIVHKCGGATSPWRAGVMNIGVRPTVGGLKEQVEVHLLDVCEDLYGQSLRVKLIARIRDELRFASLEALREQITADVQSARSLLKADTDVNL